MKKQILALTLSIFIVALSGCGGKNNQPQTETTFASTTIEPTTEETTPQTEHTAEELSKKTLPEIIDIMGGNFNRDDSKGVIYYTSGGFYIYNDETLPGFVFYIDEAEKDYNKLKDSIGEKKANSQIIKDIKSGKYKNYSFIALYDSAKLNESISADMTYKEFLSAYGEIDTTLLPGSGTPGSYLNYKKGNIDTVIVYYSSFEEAYSSSETVSKSVMNKNNPEIDAIVVLPKNKNEDSQEETKATEKETKPTQAETKPTKKPTTKPKQETKPTEKPATDTWKTLYINHLKNTDIGANSNGYFIKLNNDNIPEIVLTADFEMATDKLLWIDSSNNVHEETLKNIWYLEGQGKILHSKFTPPGHSFVQASKLSNNEFKTTFDGSYDGPYNFSVVSEAYTNGNSTDIQACYIEGNEVPEDQFFNSLISAFDFTSPNLKSIWNDNHKSFSTANPDNAILNY